MSEPKHNYRRPGWLCTACGVPWPCASKRAEFLAKFADPDDDARLYGRARLRAILGALVLDFERDQPEVAKGEVYARFVAWTYEGAPSWSALLAPPRHPGFRGFGPTR
jgi:hypothetical protein